MLRESLVVLMLLCAVHGLAERSPASLNFNDLYRATQGEGQIAAKKYEQAYDTYSKLAAESNDPETVALAEARAAVALGLRKDKYEEGLKLADAVADRPFSVQAQMQLMIASNDYQKLVDAFGQEDIAAWPERQLPSLPRVGREDVRALALFDRGRAFLKSGDTQSASRDLDCAVEFAGRHRKLDILSFLAREVYAGTLKDTDKAFETNMRIVELNAGYAATFHAAIAATGYLGERERYDEALAVLNRYPWRTWGGFWFVRFANTTGQTLANAGRLTEAADVYLLIVQADEKRADGNARGAAAVQRGRMLVAAGDTEGARTVYKGLLEREDIPEKHRQLAEAALAELALEAPGSAK